MVSGIRSQWPITHLVRGRGLACLSHIRLN